MCIARVSLSCAALFALWIHPRGRDTTNIAEGRFVRETLNLRQAREKHGDKIRMETARMTFRIWTRAGSSCTQSRQRTKLERQEPLSLPQPAPRHISSNDDSESRTMPAKNQRPSDTHMPTRERFTPLAQGVTGRPPLRVKTAHQIQTSRENLMFHQKQS